MEDALTDEGSLEDVDRSLKLPQMEMKVCLEVIYMREQYLRNDSVESVEYTRKMEMLVELGHESVLSE